MARGKLITFEGGEGAGKSTQAARLADALRHGGLRVHATREPGGSPGGEEIRKLLVTGDPDRWDPMCEALLNFAARRDHVRTVIEPRLAEGDWVVCDRFADSTMAYQGYGHRLGPAPVDALYRLAIGDFAPDLTLILDLSVEIGLQRAAARSHGEDRYERLAAEFHERLRAGFRKIAQQAPSRCVLIDASGGVDAVHAQIRESVARRLGVAWP